MTRAEAIEKVRETFVDWRRAERRMNTQKGTIYHGDACAKYAIAEAAYRAAAKQRDEVCEAERRAAAGEPPLPMPAYRVLVTLEASVEVDGDDERACVLAAREAVKNNPAALQVVSIKHRGG